MTIPKWYISINFVQIPQLNLKTSTIGHRQNTMIVNSSIKKVLKNWPQPLKMMTIYTIVCLILFIMCVQKQKNAELYQNFCIHADAATNQHVCAKHDEKNQHVSEECPHVMFIWPSVLNINVPNAQS